MLGLPHMAHPALLHQQTRNLFPAEGAPGAARAEQLGRPQREHEARAAQQAADHARVQADAGRAQEAPLHSARTLFRDCRTSSAKTPRLSPQTALADWLVGRLLRHADKCFCTIRLRVNMGAMSMCLLTL